MNFLKEAVTPIIEAKGAYLIDIVVRSGQRRRRVEIVIDHDCGVTVGLCAEISRELSRVLDSSNVFTGKYDLIVSSPGIGSLLKLQRQYVKNIGRMMEVKFLTNGQTEKIVGKLIAANGQHIEILDNKGKMTQILFEHILEARVTLSL